MDDTKLTVYVLSLNNPDFSRYYVTLNMQYCDLFQSLFSRDLITFFLAPTKVDHNVSVSLAGSISELMLVQDSIYILNIFQFQNVFNEIERFAAYFQNATFNLPSNPDS